ncbi:PREDICTED: disease resistance protein RPM1-like [Ipomoea nil]|uniref:disease resistance protein RPM1-like n=1 Tax=Ipomoea nil TaxID=35883 RepID=UPI000901ED49|nr:PREDICTED: disease resistance protein RPM1-like [Ipomoea nil]
MAEAAVTFVLGQLSVLIREEYSFLGGIRDDAQDVENAFHRLTAVLRVADEREEIDPQVQAWVKIIRELVYDTEDVLDEFQFRFGGSQTNGGLHNRIKNKYTSVKNLRARRRLARELRRIKARVNNISQEQPRLLLTTSDHTIHNSNKRVYDGRRDALLLKDSDLVGIDNPKLSLVNCLLAVDKDLRVHSVVGMGGLGKTTLVKKVFDDARVANHFQRRVWLTISETFNVDELLKDAIRQIIKQTNEQPPQDFEALDTDKLKEFINNILSGQRYIIVLDDIWDVDAWMAFKPVFPGHSFGSCIVITTRNNEIGVFASHDKVYSLEPLSDKDSWALFCRKTFLGDSCPQHLVNISKTILKRCGGLPLAIVVIAGVLATKSESIEEWERFQRNLNNQLESNDGGMKNMKNLLSLSYYDLPYYLKYCFLYLSIFPEDVIIEKMRVIRLWIAEGFVRENNHQEKEEVGEVYLNGLLHRNLIQIVEKTRNGKMKAFRVHDILREFILSKSKEQNFTIIIATGQNTEPSAKFRRLAVHRLLDHNILKCASSKMHLRSLQFFEPLSSSTMSSSLPKMFTAKYIPLKVLDLRGAELEEIPTEVFNLFQLKYLSLRRTKLKSVSKAIGRLQNLETLDLKHTDVIELPAELLKLCKLRHLLVYHYQDRWINPWISTQSFNAPFEIGGLVSLQKLCIIQANDTLGIKTVSEIGKLTQLRRLAVSKMRQEDGKEFCLSLGKLTNLCSLSLTSTSEDEVLDIQHPLHVPLGLQRLYLKGPLEMVPQWLSLLVGLTCLEFGWCRLREDSLLFIEDLPMLAHLKLLAKSYEGEGLCFKAKKFSKLKSLIIYKLEALKWIRMEEGTLDHLEEFDLGECSLVEEMPMGIEHLSDLKVITIYDLADKFNANLVSKCKRSEVYAKISHIPEINISHKIDGKRKFFF